MDSESVLFLSMAIVVCGIFAAFGYARGEHYKSQARIIEAQSGVYGSCQCKKVE